MGDYSGTLKSVDTSGNIRTIYPKTTAENVIGLQVPSFGTCDTEANVAEKVVVIDDENWTLKAGSIIIVIAKNTNTAQNPKLNVNGTGAKEVMYGTAVVTTSNLSTVGYANRPITFCYDGNKWVWISHSVDNNTTYSNASLGQGYGTCTTAAATVAKVVSLSSYSISTGGIVSVKFTYDVPASATLNINSKGAKSVYHKGKAIASGVIKAGDIATFIYSTQYHLIAIDRLSTETHPNIYAQASQPTGLQNGDIWFKIV